MKNFLIKIYLAAYSASLTSVKEVHREAMCINSYAGNELLGLSASKFDYNKKVFSAVF